MPQPEPRGISRRRAGGALARQSRVQDPRRGRTSYSFSNQIRRHSVALISLFLAATSLGYNTWRNETSELHRNWRQAAFEVMAELGEIQQIVLYRRYFHATEEHPLTPLRHAETWVGGWGKVITVRDLTSVLPEPLPERGSELYLTWQRHAGALDGESEAAREAEQALVDSIAETRRAILELIESLR